MRFLGKIREIAKKTDGVSPMWIILGVLIVAAIAAVIFANLGGGKFNPATDNYTKYLGDTNRILSVQNIEDAQNKFANGGEKKSDWKAPQPIIADQVIGDKNAKVIVVQYEDFACSACTAFEPSAKKIHADYADKSVAFVYRNFSIGQPTSLTSQAGAQVAYLLGGDDALWEISDKIFEDQQCYEGLAQQTCQKALDKYAAEMKFDVKKFDDLVANFAKNGIQDKLNRDKNMGNAAGITATPSWIITGPNGSKTISGGNDSEMRAAIDAALKSVK